ncbi:MAG: 50S ribosomal protein L25 [Candidatus Yanofskybacteria bacterium GW2011_GWF1_44_227]|uniref:Large ribosomal subunit protein bL25 n=1 Tax=Candidatus Yanofskybacteria bacterium GW2011_GWE2_40_11 TaxID=1619033 RepID=A0A0G0QJI7_9BACT|nr:MAG: 50S ribosomal protein L25 [Candidatus Yanofskybacteria bacterium GW2011_GWE1_40_10]KKR40529.1 MAG: 50S ribosomal protein L25 [Candidatus Yanofskybacteria bacterium GW2011_GWE2_40_11]KKT15170.1 MAG: 50S ribosomal protein L25 [Candidatus Yanofskybacteria bacterium GW2011_GWF2_43_596]KKT52797.1 MAG: 50S ribosomal protein L25 [Candidatus Yanofskybacteria bacterium GW2011_GWF1_44_227]OGN35473.1 MAG: hypothetical protein A2207_01910 [Candidatus Yanofskybacteria bacterium RIFOXYA1_FULL_44_17]
MKHVKDKIELSAQKREVTGAKVSQLRKEGLVPGVLYGRGQESISLQVPIKDFNRTLKLAGESTLVYLTLEGKSYPTIINDVVIDPIKDTVVHADFYKVNLDEKIKAMVPVEFEGESAAVKDLGGILVKNISEIEVEALPQDLPHEIKIDISSMVNIGDHLAVGDIKVDAGVKIIANMEDTIAIVQAPKTEEQLEKELEQTTVSVEDVEEIKREKADETEEGAEATEAKE